MALPLTSCIGAWFPMSAGLSPLSLRTGQLTGSPAFLSVLLKQILHKPPPGGAFSLISYICMLIIVPASLMEKMHELHKEYFSKIAVLVNCRNGLHGSVCIIFHSVEAKVSYPSKMSPGYFVSYLCKTRKVIKKYFLILFFSKSCFLLLYL